jgi:carbon storage regulator
MLVLSRKIGERICIGDDVVVTIVDIQGSRVRIGIVAPPEVVVDRQEISERKRLSLGQVSAFQCQPVHAGICQESLG